MAQSDGIEERSGLSSCAGSNEHTERRISEIGDVVDVNSEIWSVLGGGRNRLHGTASW
jgi:hypothetical protein